MKQSNPKVFLPAKGPTASTCRRVNFGAGNKKILVICGPTATGKTALGIKLAKKFSSKGGLASGWNGEIISADSRQVYRGMDVGTGKDFPVPNSKLKTQNSKLNIKIQNYQIGYYLFDKIPVWLLDVARLDQKFSVAHWVKFARLVIADIWERKKLPIIVGGTGFWIKALIEGMESIGIRPDWDLRKQLSNLAIEQLRGKLKKIDPKRFQRMNKSDRNNARRLTRAIEIAREQSKTASSVILSAAKNLARRRASKYFTRNSALQNSLDFSTSLRFARNDILSIGLKTKDYKSLYKRIDKRVEKRVKHGAQKEVENLFKKYSWKNSVLGTTIGYKEWQGFFRPKDDQPMAEKAKKEVIEDWKFSEHAYARRQMTWFKKQRGIKWFDIDDKDWEKEVVEEIKKWYSIN